MSGGESAIRAAFEEAGVRPPNFFIVGAPKCGTTSMALSLRRHHDIFMSKNKEPLFFGSDLETEAVKGRLDLGDYIELFRGSGDASRLGEASVWYLRSKDAPVEILEFAPDARVIVMLRNPVEVLQSFHAQALRSGIEDLRDLGEALAAEPDRRRKLHSQQRLRYPGRLLYSEVVRFSSQLGRYYEVFQRSAVHVVLYDDILRDPTGVMRTAQEFLGVQFDEELHLSHANQGRVVRNLRLQALIRQPPPKVRSVAHALLSRALRARIGRRMLRGLQAVNVRNVKPTPMSDHLRAQLTDRFRPEVESLSKILGRDLSEWLKVR